MVEIVIARPPNFDEVVAVFPMATKPGVIFTYGDKIYNPSAAQISPQLKQHEAVHAQRQREHAEGVEGWWKLYLRDAIFRLAEELEAHRAEYRAFKSWTKDRNAVARELHEIAARLSGPLYGGLLSYQAARRFIVVHPGG